MTVALHVGLSRNYAKTKQMIRSALTQEGKYVSCKANIERLKMESQLGRNRSEAQIISSIIAIDDKKRERFRRDLNASIQFMTPTRSIVVPNIYACVCACVRRLMRRRAVKD